VVFVFVLVVVLFCFYVLCLANPCLTSEPPKRLFPLLHSSPSERLAYCSGTVKSTVTRSPGRTGTRRVWSISRPFSIQRARISYV
jgi:hypothetical protein